MPIRTLKALRPKSGPTGLLRWNLPDTSLSVIWDGPGSPLYLVHDVPGGSSATGIMFEGYVRSFSTRKEAQAGFEQFLARDGA